MLTLGDERDRQDEENDSGSVVGFRGWWLMVLMIMMVIKCCNDIPGSFTGRRQQSRYDGSIGLTVGVLDNNRTIDQITFSEKIANELQAGHHRTGLRLFLFTL